MIHKSQKLMFLHLKIFCLHWKCDRFGIRIIGSEMILNPFGFAGKAETLAICVSLDLMVQPSEDTGFQYCDQSSQLFMARQHGSYDASIYSTSLNVWRLLGIVQLVLFVALSWNFHLRSD
jgi:hypothetical protein